MCSGWFVRPLFMSKVVPFSREHQQHIQICSCGDRDPSADLLFPHQALSFSPWHECRSCEELLTRTGPVSSSLSSSSSSSSGTCGVSKEMMVWAVSVRSLRGEKRVKRTWNNSVLSDELMPALWFHVAKRPNTLKFPKHLKGKCLPLSCGLIFKSRPL